MEQINEPNMEQIDVPNMEQIDGAIVTNYNDTSDAMKRLIIMIEQILERDLNFSSCGPNYLIKDDITNSNSVNITDIITINNCRAVTNINYKITNEELFGKLNKLVNKVYVKLEKSIQDEADNDYIEILNNSEKKSNVVNIICSIILDKIDNLI